jgi:hypothetical protein
MERFNPSLKQAVSPTTKKKKIIAGIMIYQELIGLKLINYAFESSCEMIVLLVK